MSKSTKARNADHVRRTNCPSPENEVIQERLEALLTPAVNGQLDYYTSHGQELRFFEGLKTESE